MGGWWVLLYVVDWPHHNLLRTGLQIARPITMRDVVSVMAPEPIRASHTKLFDEFSQLRIMEVNDQYVEAELFERFLEEMPQVCVELVVESDEGILLAKRVQKPAVWFWPGGRLYKGENLEDAAHRIAREELGIAISLETQLGVHSHFWDPTEVGEGVSRHTVNIVYHVTPDSQEFQISLDEQHSEYQFINEVPSDGHQYVREYLTTHDLV